MEYLEPCGPLAILFAQRGGGGGGEWLGLCCPLVVFLFMIGLGLLGFVRERMHFSNLQRREEETADVLVTQLKSFPNAITGGLPPKMIVVEVVIATDYLKNFIGGIRKIFGGRIGTYSAIMERARREALLRIVEQAREQGYNAVCNVRIQTADVGGSTMAQRAVMGAVIATGTAYLAQAR